MAINAHFIAGQWLQGSGALLTKLAPENQAPLWQAASAGAAEVQAACAGGARRFLCVVSSCAGGAYCLRAAVCRAAGCA
nr:succinylglutamic semialdehyde dehydrogenase [Raoultella sp. NCTC 9187]